MYLTKTFFFWDLVFSSSSLFVAFLFHVRIRRKEKKAHLEKLLTSEWVRVQLLPNSLWQLQLQVTLICDNFSKQFLVVLFKGEDTFQRQPHWGEAHEFSRHSFWYRKLRNTKIAAVYKLKVLHPNDINHRACMTCVAEHLEVNTHTF